MLTQREWTTIREYEDILFDYYNGICLLYTSPSPRDTR